MSSFLEFSKELNTTSAEERRDPLIKKMSKLSSTGINCFSCEGVCCSFIANSMKTTPLETLDLAAYLESQDRITDELVQELKHAIKHYRLDYDIDTGRGTSIRRTYTCPFYVAGAKGCTISRKHKPYGCLAFNAFKEGSKEGETCAPDFDLLKDQEAQYGQIEADANALLSKKLGIKWEKLPMPVALLQFIEALK